VPLMKLFEEVGIDLEQIQRGGVRHASRFHETEQEEQIVELRRLLPDLALVPPERRPAQDIREAGPNQRQGHRPTSILTRIAVPPRSSSPNAFETPAVPSTPGTCVYSASMPTPTHRWRRTSTPPWRTSPAPLSETSSAAWSKLETSE